MRIAQQHLDQLPRIKKRVQNAHDYFKHNYDTYNEFIRFVFEHNLTNDEVTMLMTRSMPQLEFNVLEARIARLLGEFSKQEPDIMVTADDQSKADWMTLKVVEQHLRHVLLDIDNTNLRYEIYKDVLAGGFSCLKVYTDYANKMSFDQVIKFERCEPTLTVFDKNAKLSHKGDGMFCAELFPKDKEAFQEEFPDVPINTIAFARNAMGFNWSYINDKTPIVLIADYYEKVMKEKMIVQVADGKSEHGTVMLKAKYDKMVEEWDDITVPPQTIGKPRKTLLEQINRYRIIENQVIEFEETDYEMLPLVFVDGSSVMVKTPKNGNVRQVCRPYVYHAKDAQRMKNFAGIALMNEIENTTQAKLMVAKEALPKEEEFQTAYKDPQQANVYVFNSVHEGNPDMPIQNPIREVQKVPAPPEIFQAFSGSDGLMEQVLGSYDASLGINNNQLSGVAIVEGATQSNSAAMPYIVGFMQGLQRAAQIYVNLLPKYYTTPRTIPILDEEGKRNYVKINTQDGMPFDFDTNALNVVVKAGASFQVQKSRTIMMVKEMMGMSQEFSQFIASKGLNFVLDNMEGRGIEQLKSMVEEFQQEMQQQKQMAQQQQQAEMQNNPVMMKTKVEMAKLQQQAKEHEEEHQLKMQELALEEKKLMIEAELEQDALSVQLVKAQTERIVHNADKEHKIKDMKHRHIKEALELHIKARKPEKHATH